jgi:hypothetical protein
VGNFRDTIGTLGESTWRFFQQSWEQEGEKTVDTKAFSESHNRFPETKRVLAALFALFSDTLERVIFPSRLENSSSMCILSEIFTYAIK